MSAAAQAAPVPIGAVLGAKAGRPPESEARRTREPVRRDSRRVGEEPPIFRQSFRRGDKRDFLSSAEIYDRVHRRRGERNGPLGHVGREVLRTLINMAITGGRGRLLEPSVETLMRWCRRSKDAVVRALAALKQHGFLDWIRRFEPTDGPRGARGPQVRQATNAYRLRLPPAAAKLLRRHAAEPDDHAARTAERAAELRRYAAQAAGLDEAGDRLGVAVERRNASPLTGKNPDQESI